MKPYTKTYIEYFGYGEQDFIPSEITGDQAVDPHHIVPKSAGGGDNIENLIALTRKQHDRAHFRIEPHLQREELQRIHNNFMKNHG